MTTATELPQHLEALERANRTRLARAELKRAIARGETTVADVLDPGREIPWEADAMPVFQLLSAQHRWGRNRARKVLMHLGIGELRHVGKLTPRQRRRLIEVVDGEHVEERLLAA